MMYLFSYLTSCGFIFARKFRYNLEKFPREIQASILCHVDDQTLLSRCPQVCRTWNILICRNTCSEAWLWIPRIRSKFRMINPGLMFKFLSEWRPQVGNIIIY